MDTRGQCVVESDPITIVLALRPFLNIVRRKGMKFFFMVLDDLWLYNYHKQKYKGVILPSRSWTSNGKLSSWTK